jgi:hypothetical protein
VWTDGPETVGLETLRPAGAVWPCLVDGSAANLSLDLTYEHGFGAWVLASAVRAGACVNSFNVSRLLQETDERAGHDPWLIDGARLVAAICDGKMRVNYLVPEALHEVALPSLPGTWFSRSPFRAPVAGSDGSVLVPAGSTLLYGADGGRARVEVDADGRAWWAVYL